MGACKGEGEGGQILGSPITEYVLQSCLGAAEAQQCWGR